jgi:hypothetical protein
VHVESGLSKNFPAVRLPPGKTMRKYVPVGDVVAQLPAASLNVPTSVVVLALAAPTGAIAIMPKIPVVTEVAKARDVRRWFMLDSSSWLET